MERAAKPTGKWLHLGSVKGIAPTAQHIQDFMNGTIKESELRARRDELLGSHGSPSASSDSAVDVEDIS